jgi:hypothetical protein
MIAVLLGAGTGLLLAGLAAIVYGMPIKEFSFGSTMILAGVIAACSGAIMLGLFVVARQLQNIAQGLGGGIAVAPHGEPALEPAAALRGQPGDSSGGSLFGRDEPPGESAGAAGPDGTALQDGGPAQTPPAPQPAEATPPLKPRRNLLFSSSSRKERERATTRTSEPLAPDLLSPDLRPLPSDAPPVSEPAEPPSASFDDAWPKPERGRPGEAPPLRRGGRSPSTFADADAPAGAANRDGPPQVTVLKSGVVDGMAYSLYSDGSIEAQMPEGMMRFASIDELRAHLDHRP